MLLKADEAVIRCEEKMKTRLNYSVRMLVSDLVEQYQSAIVGVISFENARDWYLDASDIYEECSRYRGALQHAYLYCEERIKDLPQDS